MNIETFRTYCLSKKGVTESLPFGDNTLVFKVGNKMFALCNIEQFEFINLKCNPELSIELRETYNGIKPGYHMNKTHWNSVYTNMDVDDSKIIALTDMSYDLILVSLPKKTRENL
ncbi:MAG: MmcQ/YjbR family DNA-binding protein [Putridiphycobacter sp.]